MVRSIKAWPAVCSSILDQCSLAGVCFFFKSCCRHHLLHRYEKKEMRKKKQKTKRWSLIWDFRCLVPETLDHFVEMILPKAQLQRCKKCCICIQALRALYFFHTHSRSCNADDTSLLVFCFLYSNFWTILRLCYFREKWSICLVTYQ